MKNRRKEMDSAIVSSVLQRYGEGDGGFYERRIPTDLERQILNRIQEIYDNPNKIEQDAQKVRVENSEFANEQHQKERQRMEDHLFVQYTKYAQSKQLQAALRFFEANQKLIIDGCIRVKDSQRLILDVQQLAALIYNKKLTRIIGEKWIKHTLIDLFLPVLQRRTEVVVQCQDSIRIIAKIYPEWEALLNQKVMTE